MMLLLDSLYSIISEVRHSDTSVSYRIRLNPDSVIFKAHFPGEPILPGACITQIATELYSVWTSHEAEISKIANLKFLSIISPAEVSDLDVNIEIAKVEGRLTHIKTNISQADSIYTKMSLVLR